MVAKNQNANGIVLDAEEKIVGESVEIHPSEIPFPYIIFFWIVGCVANIKLEFGIKLVCKMAAGYALV